MFVDFDLCDIKCWWGDWWEDFRLGVKQFFCWHDYGWKTEGGLGTAYGYEECSKCKKVRM